MSEPSKCCSCGASIRFVRSAKSNGYMVLNADPRPDGNVVIMDDGLAHVLSHDLFEEMLPAAAPHYVSHFATCPNRQQHRKRTRQ